MGGILHHLAAGIISAVIVWFIFKRKDYPISIFIGNFLPDIIGAGYASLMIRSINPAVVLKSAAWFSIDKDYVTQSFWIFFQAIFIVAYLFFHVYVKKKRPHKEIEGNLALMLFGFLTHMMMDMLIIEQGIWY
jgi:hypothetical protein